MENFKLCPANERGFFVDNILILLYNYFEYITDGNTVSYAIYARECTFSQPTVWAI